jgi:hypothetical protein
LALVRPATRSAASDATTAKNSRMRKPTVPAVPGSMRRNSDGPSRRPKSRARPNPSSSSAAAAASRIGASIPKMSSRKTNSVTVAAVSSTRTNVSMRARLTALLLSWRARPTSCHEWLWVSNNLAIASNLAPHLKTA